VNDVGGAQVSAQPLDRCSVDRQPGGDLAVVGMLTSQPLHNLLSDLWRIHAVSLDDPQSHNPGLLVHETGYQGMLEASCTPVSLKQALVSRLTLPLVESLSCCEHVVTKPT
jgi:hypothetical protein